MHKNDVIKELKALDQYEIDGALLLDQAIGKLNHEETKEQLRSIKAECEESINEFEACIRNLGEVPPDYSRDTMGYFMQAYEAVRGLTSDKGVMEALDTNTKPLMRYYEKVLSLELPEDVRETIEKMHSKAKNHADYFARQTQNL